MTAPFNPAEAACRRKPSPTNSPPVAATTEGPSIAMGANAAAPYPATGYGDKVFGSPRIGPNRETRRRQANQRFVTYRGSCGRVWTFSGKRGRVLAMLATMPQGVTQWDCYPWHTRLGASVHALRREGVVIDTEREGEYRHARYRLTTPGCLIMPRQKSHDREGQE